MNHAMRKLVSAECGSGCWIRLSFEPAYDSSQRKDRSLSNAVRAGTELSEKPTEQSVEPFGLDVA